MEAFLLTLVSNPMVCLAVGLVIILAAALSWHEAKKIGEFAYLFSRMSFVVAGLAFSRAYAWAMVSFWQVTGIQIKHVRPVQAEPYIHALDPILLYLFASALVTALLLGLWQIWRREQLHHFVAECGEEAVDVGIDVLEDLAFKERMAWYPVVWSSHGSSSFGGLPSFGGSSSSDSFSFDSDDAGAALVAVLVVIAACSCILGFVSAFVLVRWISGSVRDATAKSLQKAPFRYGRRETAAV